MKIIQAFENAVPDELIERVYKFIETANLKDVGYDIQKDVLGCSIDEPNLYNDIKNLGFDFAEKYFSKFDPIPYEFKIEDIGILRYPDGTCCENHLDCEIITDREDFSALFLIMIIFLNDDYEGGEQVFKDQDIVVKPQKGKIATFAASFITPHAVTKVHGVRDVIRINFAV